MKKPSSQILDIIDANTAPDGTVTLSAETADTIRRLCKIVDKRDQQLRKGKKMPAAKAAKKKARR